MTVTTACAFIAPVHLEPTGLELPIGRAGSTLSVTVPKLDIHAMVVAERRADQSHQTGQTTPTSALAK